VRLFALFGLSIFLIGCRLEPDAEELLENMVVQTRYDENTCFNCYSSFTLSLDTIGFLSNRSRDTLAVGPLVSQITETIKNDMSAKGYGFLPKNQNPDLGFATYVVENYSVFQTVNYPSYYSGYYGYGYGGYYGVPYVSTYISSSTTMVINLIDLKNRDSQGRLKVIWTAYIGDIANSNNPTVKIVQAIDQAFDQSPYFFKP
jgi:hypothetical protein